MPQFFVSNISDSATLNEPEDNSPRYILRVLDSLAVGSLGGLPTEVYLQYNSTIPMVWLLILAFLIAVHESLRELPFFGDTTSNQAPNYTLPVANMS
jgi:hypothetical protein